MYVIKKKIIHLTLPHVTVTLHLTLPHVTATLHLTLPHVTVTYLIVYICMGVNSGI